MGKSTPADVTSILKDWSEGRPDAAERLLPVVYAELRRLARDYMAGERPGHTLQPTALVHEAFLRMVDQRNVTWQNRAHFFGVAAQMMRRILVDHARARLTEKRGGQILRVPLDDALTISLDGGSDRMLVALDDALTTLKGVDPGQSRLVELRYFAGLTLEETAGTLGVSTATVKREWTMVKAWLRREMEPQAEAR
jgi:RNA polymerase sigma-70 factor (ECF subfamily)